MSHEGWLRTKLRLDDPYHREFFPPFLKYFIYFRTVVATCLVGLSVLTFPLLAPLLKTDL